MNTNKKGLWLGLTAVALTLSGGSLFADGGPTVSGYVDTTYTYNFLKPYTGKTALRVYDADDNTFVLNTAHLAFTGSMGDAGYVVEVDAGHDAVVTSASDDFDIQEAYGTYACPMTKINFKMGKFVTPTGIEVIESKDNPTVSRGYLFGLAEPFTHTGAMASRTFGILELGIGVVNGWDMPVDNNRGKTLLGKVGINLGDPLTFTISGYSGAEQDVDRSTSTSASGNLGSAKRNMIDITGVTKIIPKVALWFQANYGDEQKAYKHDDNLDLAFDPITERSLAKWSGAGIQPVVTITDKLSLGARLEYFADPEGVRTNAGFTDVCTTNFTITPAYKLTDNTIVRLEYRMDESNKKIWVNDSGTAKDSVSTVSFNYVVTF